MMASDEAVSPAISDHATAIVLKRPHKKSRLGCTNCKLRKVKCDEGRPICRSCKLRRAKCEYEPSKAGASARSLVATNASKPAFMSLPQTMSPGYEPALCGLSVSPMDMKLLWFYTASTYKSLSYIDNMQNAMNEMLQTVMVQLAFEAPFLMDTLLELAASHMQSLGQAIEPTRALVYRDRSIEGYRKAIQDARPETFGALLSSGVLRPMLSTYRFRDPTSPNLYLPDWMLLWRGVSSLLSITSYASIAKSGIQSLFYRPPFDPDAATAAIPKDLLLMVSFIDASEADAADLGTYQEGLRALGGLFDGLQVGLDSVMVVRIATWGTLAPPRLVDLAQAGRPRALVILAHYAMFLKLLQDIWWMVDVGDRSMKDICHQLDVGWHKYLKMPLSGLLVDEKEDLIPLILGSSARK